MAPSRRRLALRVAALTLSTTGAVLMSQAGSVGAAVATRPAPTHPAAADTESRDRRHADHAAHRDNDAHHDRDRSHGSHGRDSHGSHAEHDRDRHSTTIAPPPGGETRDPGCGDADSSDTNCSGDRGVDRGTAHRASGVAAGRVPASAPAPVPATPPQPAAPASAASRPAPPDPEPAPAASSGAAPAPVVPATGALERVGPGLILCFAGLFGLALARRPARRP